MQTVDLVFPLQTFGNIPGEHPDQFLVQLILNQVRVILESHRLSLTVRHPVLRKIPTAAVFPETPEPIAPLRLVYQRFIQVEHLLADDIP